MREIGRQRASAARWILLVSPPRERPSASRPGLVAGLLSFDRAPRVQLGDRDDLGGHIGRRLASGTGGMLVGPHDPSVDPDDPFLTHTHVGVAAQLAQHPAQVPSADQRRCRLYTVFQFPYSRGRSRHGDPVRVLQNTPSSTAR